MSCDEIDAKRRCVENDNATSAPSSRASRTSFRDLIFSVSGTVPASVRENSQMDQSAGPLVGKRNLSHNLDDCNVDVDVKEKSDGDKRSGRSLAGFVNESDVGITEFISKHNGFSGILKQR